MQASKSHEYPVGEMQALGAGKHIRKMILCKVAPGNELKTSSNMDGLTGGAPEGYNSVHGVATEGGPLNYDELVVYAEEAILPYAVVTYEFTKHGPAGASTVSEEGASPEPETEELLVVKATGEALTIMELFGLKDGECDFFNK